MTGATAAPDRWSRIGERLPPEHWPLPAHAHVPGENERPDEALMSAVIAAGPPTTSDRRPDNPLWRYGLRLASLGYFFEAHEVLEPVWLRAEPNSRERKIVRAVIQLANAALKLRMGRPNAAARLVLLARAEAAEAFLNHDGRLLGITHAGFAAAAATVDDSDVVAGFDCENVL